MLYNLIEINTLNSNTLLDIIGMLSIISAISIIIVSNPMYSILYLIGLFINIGLYLYLIGISILSLLYLLVYVGAIAILFLFILSLFSAVNSENDLNEINWFNSNINSNNYPLVLFIIYLLYKQAYKYYDNIYNSLITSSNYDENISLVYHNNWFNIFDFNHLNQIGYLLYTEYSIIFIVLSIILLFSIVSAIVLTYNK